MKFSAKGCKIVGVRVGEVSLNLVDPRAASLHAKFFLLRDPEGLSGMLNVGSYTKTGWREQTLEALQKFIECMEADALVDLFDDEGTTAATTSESSGLSFPPVPVLGGPKRNDTP